MNKTTGKKNFVLITGASAGIGEACAHAFAQTGRNLFLVARRTKRLEEISKVLKNKYDVQIEISELDVSKSTAVEKWAAKSSSLLDQTDVLINNAGMARGLDPIQSGDIKNWDEMIDTNIKGFLYVTRSVLPHFISANRGHIVNLGSVAGYWAYPKGNVYSATKFAVRALNESLRLDLLGTKIRVTEIAPGMVETEFSLVRYAGDSQKAKTVYQGMTPLSGQDIAESIVWCVNRPAHVNIQELVIYPTDQASTTSVHRTV